jgi:hypothetical protein
MAFATVVDSDSTLRRIQFQAHRVGELTRRLRCLWGLTERNKLALADGTQANVGFDSISLYLTTKLPLKRYSSLPENTFDPITKAIRIRRRKREHRQSLCGPGVEVGLISASGARGASIKNVDAHTLIRRALAEVLNKVARDP